MVFSCSKNDERFSDVDILFTTLKKGNIYKDLDSKHVIGEFPAYVSVPASKKFVSHNNSPDSVFYEITYTKYTGWVKGQVLTAKPKNKRIKDRLIKNKKIKKLIKQELISSDSSLITKKTSSNLNKKKDFIDWEKEIENSKTKKYFVQAGSFKDLSLANSLKKKLSDLGIENTFISKPILIENTTWYRVYIDVFDNYKSALESSKAFSKKHSINTSVGLENQNINRKSKTPEQTKVKNNLILDYYTLQLNAVENLTMAKLLVDKYEVMGLETEIIATKVSSKTRYRVRYGKFDRIAKAQTAAKLLKDKYNLDSWADNVYK